MEQLCTPPPASADDSACLPIRSRNSPEEWKSTYLILPGNRDASCCKLVVEVMVGGLQLYPLDCRELLNVQYILAINSLGLSRMQKREGNERAILLHLNTTNRWYEEDAATHVHSELTSGLNGGSSIPASNRLKFKCLKRGCSFTS